MEVKAWAEMSKAENSGSEVQDKRKLDIDVAKDSQGNDVPDDSGK